MSKTQKDLEKAAKVGYAVIGEIAAAGVLGPAGVAAVPALKAIEAIVTAVGEGFDRKITPSEVLARIEASRATLTTTLADNDARHLAELEARFPDRAPPETP